MKTRTLALVAGLSLAAGSLALMGGWGAQPKEAAAPAGTFAVDRVHTSVIFRVQRTTGAPFYGRFNDITGWFNIDADAAKSTMEITIPIESVDSNNEGRNKHLKTADFFSSGEYPTATFKATKFTKTADKEYDVAGDLTIRGSTKPAVAKVKETGSGPARGGGTTVGLDVQLTIKRSEFGINYGMQALSDEVKLMIGLEGIKK